MSCPEISAKLADFDLGFLEANDQRSVEEHVEKCDGCRKELASLGKLTLLLSNMQDPLIGRDLWPGIAAKLPQRRSGGPLGILRGIWERPAALSAISVLVLAISLFSLRLGNEQNSTVAIAAPEAQRELFAPYVAGFATMTSNTPSADREAVGLQFSEMILGSQGR